MSEVAQSCPTLCDSMDCRLPDPSIHEIFQARIMEWAAISFSGGLHSSTLAGESHGQRSMVGYSPCGCKELDMTGWLSTACIKLKIQFYSCSKHISRGDGNGNPFQYSCLENPMDGGAWRAIVHRVAKSWTQLND